MPREMSSSGENEERIARTESLFRGVNERIATSARRFGGDDASFVCECDDPQCTSRVEATIEEYEEVRSDGTRFLLAPGHGDRSIERVVESRGNFMIVEKVNQAARALVRRLNPRAAEA